MSTLGPSGILSASCAECLAECFAVAVNLGALVDFFVDVFDTVASPRISADSSASGFIWNVMLRLFGWKMFMGDFITKLISAHWQGFGMEFSTQN
jgi:hypothetical protein